MEQDDFVADYYESVPWDFQLVPSEPDPENYNTFEEYEEAMERWCVACHDTIHKIPPHAEQLASILPITNFEV